MSEFLSNLITRSFTDEPVIQPRVPSLFEPAAIEFLDEPQPFTPATDAATESFESSKMLPPVSRSAPTKQSSGPVGARKRRLEKNSKVIVPVDSSRDEGKDADHNRHIFEASSESGPIQSQGRKVFSRVEKPSSTSPPIVRVSIGRIEVRAVQSPAATPKPAKPPKPPPEPKLSLQEYLYKRERGT
jgi:hypothetical protein